MKPANKDRKPRADSILDSQLSEAQKEELRVMLFANRSYADCLEWLSVSCGVVVKSGDTITTFWNRHCAPIVAANRKLASARSEAYIDGAKTDWDTPTTDLMKQTTFEVLSGQSLDPKTADVFIKNLLKLREQEDARERIAEAKRTKEEAGVDALIESAKGNKKALALLKQFQEAMAK